MNVAEAFLLLFDERRGSLAATNLGIQRLGLLGVLAAAKRAGHLTRCRDVLEQLQAEGGFWVGDRLRQRFLPPPAPAHLALLLNEAGVACLDGRGFGQHGDGYLRFSYANSLANIEEALRRITSISSRWAH